MRTVIVPFAMSTDFTLTFGASHFTSAATAAFAASRTAALWTLSLTPSVVSALRDPVLMIVNVPVRPAAVNLDASIRISETVGLKFESNIWNTARGESVAMPSSSNTNSSALSPWALIA